MKHVVCAALSVVVLTTTACRSNPQAQSQDSQKASAESSAAQAAPRDSPPDYERVREFTGAAKRRLQTVAAATAAEVEQKLEPQLKPLVSQELSLGSFELGQDTTRRVGDKWVITYELHYKGIPLAHGSYANAIVGVNESDVRTLRARNVPANGVDGTEPTVSGDVAANTAKESSIKTIGTAGESDALTTSKPTLVFEPGALESQQAQLCWQVTVSNKDHVKPHRVLYSIKAIGTPTIVKAQSLVKDDHQGTVTGIRWEGTPKQATATRILPFVDVLRLPSSHVEANASGIYNFTGTGNATVRGKLESKFFRILNQSTAVPEVSPSVSGDHTAAMNLEFTGTHEHSIAQVSAFFYANRAREFAGNALAPTDLRPVDVLVNIDATCNASFTAPSPGETAVIRLFRGGASQEIPGRTCVNRAYADTIFHEFGHGIDFAIGDWVDGAYSEGFGDALAILFTRSDCYGRDSFHESATGDRCLRPADNTLVWPGTGLGIHEKGRIYSGFVFELVKALHQAGQTEDNAYAIAKRLTLGAAGLNPQSIQDAVDKTIQADDDDDNRANGTPHLAQIKAAAVKKKLWKPEWDPTS